MTVLTRLTVAAAALAISATTAMAEKGAEKWIVTDLNGQPVAEENAPNMTIEEDGRISGIAGCNSYFGSVEIDGASMKFGKGMGVTRMACPPPVDLIEWGFLDALAVVKSHEIEDGVMSMMDGAGVTVMQLRAQ